jgi:phospholipase/lecithinase/hemolysin
VAAPLFAAAPAFDAIYAFGDSLTDTGNEPAEPVLHYEGRWSNGPLWIEYLSERFGLAYNPSNNFANSGAQCDDTYRQVVESVLPTTNVNQSLFVVWAGGNDFLQEYDEYWFDDSGWDRQIAHSVGSLSNAVVGLYSKGARHILLPNTVDVTEIPTLNYLPESLRSYLRGKVRQFNTELAGVASRLRAAYPALRLVPVDFFAGVNRLLADAELYGFTEKNIDALADLTLLDKRFDGPGANYVFWDPIHPTTKAHAIIADWFHAAAAAMSPTFVVRQEGRRFALAASGLHLTQTYAVERSTNLTNWEAVHHFLCLSSNHTIMANNRLPQAFFRLSWTP